MLCLMWEYFQQSQNACSVSSALHQLAGTLLIRQRTKGIRVGWRVRGGGRRRERGKGKMSVPVSTLHHLSSFI